MLASCLLPTDVGTFRLDLHKSCGVEVPVLRSLTKHDASTATTLVRVHDGCFTSEVMRSTRCDCAQQLRAAMGIIHREGGLILHLSHNEGRGVGLESKIKAYRVQDDLGMNTYDANVYLGHEEDERSYDCIVPVLEHYGVKDMCLLTNSLRKYQVVKDLLGKTISVTNHRPVTVRAHPCAASYLASKASRSLTDETYIDFASEEEAWAELRKGRPVVVVDNCDRENEGDLIMAAEFVTPEWMSFFVSHTSGVICCAMPRERASKLDLPPMVKTNEDPHHTAFTVSVDAVHNTTTGISATERATTCRALASSHSLPSDFVRPGHIFPLVSRGGGLPERQGHTEAGVHLCRRAGLSPVAVLSEITTLDRTDMARLDEVVAFAKEHDLCVVRIDDLCSP